MHLEPIFKEDVITVDNVRTVAAFKHAIQVVDKVVEEHGEEFKKALLEQNTIQKDLLTKLLDSSEIWSRDSVKAGQRYLQVESWYPLPYYTVKTKSKDGWDLSRESSYAYIPNIYDFFSDYEVTFKNKVLGLLNVASQAIHPFSVNTSQAEFISECENLTEEVIKEKVFNSLEENQKSLDEWGEKLSKALSTLEGVECSNNVIAKTSVVNSVERKTEEFTSVFSPKSDSRSVWQVIKWMFSR